MTTFWIWVFCICGYALSVLLVYIGYTAFEVYCDQKGKYYDEDSKWMCMSVAPIYIPAFLLFVVVAVLSFTGFSIYERLPRLRPSRNPFRSVSEGLGKTIARRVK